MTTMPRICIVTANHVASNPRVVKEADALHQAGYSVTVVASNHYAPAAELDATVLAKAAWACVRISGRPSGIASAYAKLRRRACQALARAGAGGVGAAIGAVDDRHNAFLAAATGTEADLFIGHTLPGLAVAARAAERSGALVGFDAEDWHRREQAESDRPRGLTRAIERTEEALVPRCSYVTAASPLIGERYAALARSRPVTVLNVFPMRGGPAAPLEPARVQRSVYWFSQTIGPGRGIEAVMRGVALLPAEWSIHLRGTPSRGYLDELGSLAHSLGLDGRLAILPPAPPEAMPELAAPYAVGLSVELTEPENRAICLTNKTFTYLLAGTPVVLSDTPAHRLLQPDLGGAARIADLGDPASVAEAIAALCTPAAREHAWRLGRDRYNWERESAALVSEVRRVLGA